MRRYSDVKNEQALHLLITATQYAINRLDARGYSQVSGDLAVALAVVKDLTKIEPDFSKY